MSNFWDKIYSEDSEFFGEDPSDFAQKCYSHFKKYGVKRILELGCGQGRDTIFFATNGLEVHAIDYSKVAIENIYQKIREKKISLNIKHFQARRDLPFGNSYFDAIYSHMFYNMSFTEEELKSLFIESSRVLRNNGLLYFSVRSDKDVLFNKGKKIDNNIYEINGFQIRFFTKPQIKSFLSDYFEIKNIEERYEEQVNLYFVFCRKK
jgi:SAM-dependent methyltransferase